MFEVFCPMISNFYSLKESAQQAKKDTPRPYKNWLVLKKSDVTQDSTKEAFQDCLQPGLTSEHPKVFNGLSFYFDLSFLDHAAKIEFQDLMLKVTENGGMQSIFVNSKVDYVVSAVVNTDTSQKLKTAKRFNIPIVSKEFVEISIKECKLLDPDPFLLSNYSKAENFQHGTITLSNVVLSKTSRDVKKSHSKFNVVLEQYDPAILENYVLLKFVQLKGKTMTQTISYKTVINYQFYILELHAAITENYEKPSSYCVFSHEGDIKDLDNKNKSKKFCRFVTTVSEAVNIYGQLVKQITGAPKYFSYTQEYLSEKLGSPKFQKIQNEMHTNVKTVEPKIIQIIDSLWKETIRSLNNDLYDPLSIPSRKIKEAIKILHQINFVLKSNKNKAIVSRLSSEFYNILNCDQGEDLKLPDLTKKYAMCIKLHDLVQLMESCPVDIKNDPEARCRALRCNLNIVEEDSQEYKDLAQFIMINLQEEDTNIEIQNIFSLSRNSEAVLFRTDLGNKKMLFHGTSPDNLMGVVSRSLQTPNKFASSLEDNLLGLGIYFTDSSNFATKYCRLVTASGTRVLLIAEVALGNIYSTTEAEPSLSSAPPGYDSVLGIKSDDQSQSCFSENEYAIYDNRQCKLRYLVEYSFPEDTVQSMLKNNASSLPKTTIHTIREYQYNIIPTELDKEDLAGLECVDKNNNHTLSLKNIHVRSQIVDLVAKVYLFQTYLNVSDKPLEVQYVFPLSSGAAICGFEAFIGDKHIVGEVKEKNTARKEYETAKREGHGAYLLEESSRNVFTIHVGNIPPLTTAVLKITYIGELTVENDSVILNVPSLFKNKENKALVLPEFTFQASIEMATEILSISSPTHRVIRKKTDTKAVIKLIPQIEKQCGLLTNIPDIILMMRVANIHIPRMWIEKHPKRDTRACMVTFYPEFQAEGIAQSNPTIFLLDSSDTMKHSDFQALISLILLSMDKMKLNTLFNIVAFGTIQRELFPIAQPFTMDTHSKAKDFIADLRPNMGKALIAQTLRSCSLLRQNNETDFFLLTNGIGLDGNSLFNLNLKDIRVFSFGIGPQNQHFLQLISRKTGGSYVNFHSSEKTKWGLKVKNLLEKSAQLSLRDIDIEWQNEDNILQAPKKLFSIFNGFSQIIYALDTFSTVATLKAKIGQQEVSTVVSTHELSQTTGSMIHSLAARAYIQDWEDGILDDDEILNMVRKDDAKSLVIGFAKENSLVTSLTSFIAVEKRSDQNETFAEISVDKLLREVDIDILNYMAFVDDNNEDMSHAEISFDKLFREVDTALADENNEDMCHKRKKLLQPQELCTVSKINKKKKKLFIKSAHSSNETTESDAGIALRSVILQSDCEMPGKENKDGYVADCSQSRSRSRSPEEKEQDEALNDDCMGFLSSDFSGRIVHDFCLEDSISEDTASDMSNDDLGLKKKLSAHRSPTYYDVMLPHSLPESPSHAPMSASYAPPPPPVAVCFQQRRTRVGMSCDTTQQVPQIQANRAFVERDSTSSCLDLPPDCSSKHFSSKTMSLECSSKQASSRNQFSFGSMPLGSSSNQASSRNQFSFGSMPLGGSSNQASTNQFSFGSMPMDGSSNQTSADQFSFGSMPMDGSSNQTSTDQFSFGSMILGGSSNQMSSNQFSFGSMPQGGSYTTGFDNSNPTPPPLPGTLGAGSSTLFNQPLATGVFSRSNIMAGGLSTSNCGTENASRNMLASLDIIKLAKESNSVKCLRAKAFGTSAKKIKLSFACKNLEEQSQVPLNEVLKKLMDASMKSTIQYNKAISFLQENLKIRGGSLPILCSIVENLPKDSSNYIEDKIIPYKSLINQDCTNADCLCLCISIMEKELNGNGLNSLGPIISGEIMRMVRDVTILEMLLIIFLAQLDTDILIDLEGSFDYTIRNLNEIICKNEKISEYFISLCGLFVKGFDKLYPLMYASLTRRRSWEDFVFNNLKNYLLNLNE